MFWLREIWRPSLICFRRAFFLLLMIYEMDYFALLNHRGRSLASDVADVESSIRLFIDLLLRKMRFFFVCQAW